MSTLTAERQAVAANRQRNQEDFEAWQTARWRRDEITDQAERLASPMESTFNYSLAAEGLVTDLGEAILPVIDEGYKIAQHQAQFDARWAFEANRRSIEREEQHEIEAYARSRGSGVRITSLSLDKSDYPGMRAIADALGHRLPIDRPGSEDILRSRMWVPEGLVVLSPCPDAVRVDGVDIGAYDKNRQKMLVRIVTATDAPQEEHSGLITRIRDAYDTSLEAQFGGKWFAGRNQISTEDAQTFILRHPDLIDAHMGILGKIFQATTDKSERLRLMAPHRYNLAAALDDRLNGKQVNSLSDAGDTARAEGRTFDGDCPTAETATTANQQAEALGYRPVLALEILKCVNCPFCRKLVDAKKVNTPKEKSIECQSCFAKVDLATGERVDTRTKRTVKKMGAAALRKVAKIVKRPRSGDIVTTAQGKVRYEERLVIGGTVAEYVDLRTGDRTNA